MMNDKISTRLRARVTETIALKGNIKSILYPRSNILSAKLSSGQKIPSII